MARKGGLVHRPLDAGSSLSFKSANEELIGERTVRLPDKSEITNILTFSVTRSDVPEDRKGEKETKIGWNHGWGFDSTKGDFSISPRANVKESLVTDAGTRITAKWTHQRVTSQAGEIPVDERSIGTFRLYVKRNGAITCRWGANDLLRSVRFFNLAKAL